MQKYPFVARYKSPSPYAGTVLWMLGPKDGVVVYAPAALLSPPGGEEGTTEVQLFERMAPSSWELEDYTGSVRLRSNVDPTLEP